MVGTVWSLTFTAPITTAADNTFILFIYLFTFVATALASRSDMLIGITFRRRRWRRRQQRRLCVFLKYQCFLVNETAMMCPAHCCRPLLTLTYFSHLAEQC